MQRSATIVLSLLGLLWGTSTRAAGPLQYHPLPPCRLVDTRFGPFAGPPLAHGTVRPFPVRGSCGVPGTARAVLLTAAAIGPDLAGFLVLFPYNQSWPYVS